MSFLTPGVGCLLEKELTKGGGGGHGHPRTPVGYAPEGQLSFSDKR